MTRKKVKLALITNDSARKSCLKKRRVGLLKKVSELTVLCKVDAFCIILSPDEREPMTWPAPPTLQNVIAEYLILPNIDRCKKSMNQESYLKERIGKAEDLSMKNLKKNKDMDLCRYMYQLHLGKLLNDFVVNELASFGWLVQEKIINISKRMEYFDQVPSHHSSESFFVYHVGGDHGMVSPNDALHFSQISAENLMNNSDLAASGNTTHDDPRVVPYGFNMNYTLVPKSPIDHMATENSLHRGTDPRETTIGGFNMRLPHIVGNFNGGGLATNNITGGSNTMGLELPREALTTGVDYRTRARFGFLQQTHSNFLGFGNNFENVNAMSLGMAYGNQGIGVNYQTPPSNGSESGILERNWDSQMVMPNENINPQFGNGMGVASHTTNFVTNVGGNDGNNSTIWLCQPNNHIGSNINCGERSGNLVSQDTLFGATSDMQCLNTTTGNNNNNLAS